MDLTPEWFERAQRNLDRATTILNGHTRAIGLQDALAYGRALDNLETLLQEVQELQKQNERLALWIGRRMTGKEIGAAISHMIDTGELELPAEGEEWLTSEQVRQELGLPSPNQETTNP